MRPETPVPTDPQAGDPRSRGFVLAFTIILILGVTAISVGTMFNGRMGRMSAANFKHKIQTFTASDGLMTLLAQELINGQGGKYVDSTRVGKIWGDLWLGLPGDDIRDLHNALAASVPSTKRISSYYLGSHLDLDEYGIKWTGWIIPPITGSYTFFARSDNASEFYLSTDGLPENLSSKPLCHIDDFVFEWPSTGSGVSKPVPLIGGNRYYFEFYHKEGVGSDVGQMGWDGPEYFSERPISGKYLSQYPSDPAWAGTVQVGSLPVRYQVLGTGQDRYRLFTESIDTKAGSAKDTAFRTPLQQSISLKGVPSAPGKVLNLRVIHYDVNSITHTEFDKPHTAGIMKDMVERHLNRLTPTDAAYFGRFRIPKPTRNLITPNRDCGLDTWFQDVGWVWGKYDYFLGTDKCIVTPGWTHDLANTKVYDSLAFKLDVTQGPFTYVYSRMGNYNTGDKATSWRGDASEYFPIDFLGADPAGKAHNFSFCTELHTNFVYQSGLKFEFTGDDDVWAFVNDSLVIDLGGLHVAKNAFLDLDDLEGFLLFGTRYHFDFFQCERHEDRSSSRIVTNLKMDPPKGNPVASWRRDYGNLE